MSPQSAVSACRAADDLFAAGGALGLGVSLYFIHIYVTPLKRFVQVDAHQSGIHRFTDSQTCMQKSLRID